MPPSPSRVILVEDNEDDVFLLQRALRVASLDVAVQVLEDGQAAMDYFAALAQAGRAALPHLVLLDLKLPFVLGFEVLAYIRGQPELRELTVIVLTSSAETRDQEKASALRAHGYFVKPPSGAMIAQIAQLLRPEA